MKGSICWDVAPYILVECYCVAKGHSLSKLRVEQCANVAARPSSLSVLTAFLFRFLLDSSRLQVPEPFHGKCKPSD
jgi:hypothetical protein